MLFLIRLQFLKKSVYQNSFHGEDQLKVIQEEGRQ